MGGFGSGGRNRRRGHFEGARRVCLAVLRRKGLLRAGATGALHWRNSRGEASGSIGMIGGDDCVTLVGAVRSGAVKSGEEPWRPLRQRVELVYLQKPFGGAQAFLVCPACGRRALALAMSEAATRADAPFACRQCCGLVHASSQERGANRAMRRADRLRRRIGAEEGLGALIPPRPRGMHRTTYDRIFAGILAAEAEVEDELARVLARLDRPMRTQPVRTRAVGRHAGGRTPRRGFWT